MILASHAGFQDGHGFGTGSRNTPGRAVVEYTEYHSRGGIIMWMRNLLFLGLVGGGVFTLGYNLMPPRAPKPVTRYDASAYQDPDFRAAVDRVDASFRQQWAEQKLQPAPPAPDLVVARRLALGLMGTVPSLEEIRQFERLPPATAAALVARPHLAGPPLRRLLRRAAGPRLRRHRGRAVHPLSPPPVRRLAERPAGPEPALRRTSSAT